MANEGFATSRPGIDGPTNLASTITGGILTLTGVLTGARTWTIPDRSLLIRGISGTQTVGRISKFDANGDQTDSLVHDGVATGALTIAKNGTTARTATFPDAAVQVTGSAAALTTNRMPKGTSTAGVVQDGQIADTVTGNVLTIAGTLTAMRTLTMPDKSGTLAMTSDLQSGLNWNRTLQEFSFPSALIGGYTWASRGAASSSSWTSITYGNGKFVAFATGASTTPMTSPDGVTWTGRTITLGKNWTGVAYGNGRFVAIATGASTDGSGISTDGISWTQFPLPSASAWSSIVYGNGVFVAVAGGPSTVAAISSFGVTWTAQTLPSSSSWTSVTYGNGLFVAIASGTTAAATSSDGITWTAQTLPSSSTWTSVTYGNGIFVAIASGSTAAATSADGFNWTARTLPSSSTWSSIAFGNGLFVAVSSGSTAAASSPDGITWTARTLPASLSWTAVAYGNGVFASVASGSSTTASSGGALTFAGDLTASRSITTPDRSLILRGVSGTQTNGRISKFDANGDQTDSLVHDGVATGSLTIAKNGTTARTATFPDAAVQITGSAAALTAGRLPKGTATAGVEQDSQIADGVTGNVLTISGTLTALRTITVPDRSLILRGVSGTQTNGRISKFDANGDQTDSLVHDGVATGALTIAKNGTTARTATFPDAAVQVTGSAAALTAGRLPKGTATAGVESDSQIADGITGNVLTIAGALTASRTITTQDKSGTNALLETSSLHGFKNLLHNGRVLVDQRATLTTPINVPTATTTYGPDGWVAYKVNATHVMTIGKVAVVNTPMVGSLSACKLNITTGAALGAGDATLIQRSIEGTFFSRCNFGTAQAATLYYSFWAEAATTGTITVSLRNGVSARSYVANHTITAANTRQLFQGTIVGDTSGAWSTDTTLSASFTICVGAGATLQTTAGTWQAGNFLSTSSTTNFASAANSVQISDLYLGTEPIGTATSDYPHVPLDVELTRCHRYFRRFAQPCLRGVVSAATNADRMGLSLAPPMRSGPTISQSGLTVYEGSVAPAVTSLGTNSSTADAIELILTCSGGGMTIGRSVLILQGSGTMDATAEL